MVVLIRKLDKMLNLCIGTNTAENLVAIDGGLPWFPNEWGIDIL